jgi:hypothetical protein
MSEGLKLRIFMLYIPLCAIKTPAGGLQWTAAACGRKLFKSEWKVFNTFKTHQKLF